VIRRLLKRWCREVFSEALEPLHDMTWNTKQEVSRLLDIARMPLPQALPRVWVGLMGETEFSEPDIQPGGSSARIKLRRVKYGMWTEALVSSGELVATFEPERPFYPEYVEVYGPAHITDVLIANQICVGYRFSKPARMSFDAEESVQVGQRALVVLKRL
jgi:hypothetical protein